MVDWERLAISVGSIQPDGGFSSGTGHAMQALELIIGEENIYNAVDQAVAFAPGTG